MRTTSPYRRPFLLLLETKPDGAFSIDISSATGATARETGRLLHRMLGEGLIGGIAETSKRGRVTRYYALTHAESAKAASAKRSDHIGAKAKAARKPAVPEKKLTKLAGSEPVYTAATKYTVCPSCTKGRYSGEGAQPFFSALALGSYLNTGSAIERAYGP